MKILYVSRFFPYVGGREVLVLSLAEHLSQSHEVTIATPDLGRVSMDYKIINNEKGNVGRFIKHFNADIIHSHTFYLTPDIVPIAREYKIPLIQTIHGDIFGFGKPEDQEMFKDMSKSLDFIITVCEHGYKRMTENGISENKVKVVYPGIDTKIFFALEDQQNRIRTSFKLPQGRFVFVTPARMVKYKGIEVLLKAIRGIKTSILKKLFFWIITPSTRFRKKELDYSRKIIDIIREANLENTVKLSFINFSSMPFVYRAVDSYILPSLTEQFPVSILEALVSELPVIATDVGGVSEIINDQKTGFLVAPNNPVDLKEAIMEVYKRKEHLESMRKKACNLVEESFNVKKMTNEYLGIYRSFKSK